MRARATDSRPADEPVVLPRLFNSTRYCTVTRTTVFHLTSRTHNGEGGRGREDNKPSTLLFRRLFLASREDDFRMRDAKISADHRKGHLSSYSV